NVMSIMSRSCWDNPAAASQPAVPPPAMTTFLTSVVLKITPRDLRASLGLLSAIQIVEQHRPDLPRLLVIKGPQGSPRVFRQMLACALGRTEHVVVEDGPPSELLIFRPIAKTQQSMMQHIHWRPHEFRRCAKPVVNQHVERTQRLYLMPPQARQKYGITRLHVGHLPGCNRFAEPRVFLEVRIGEIHHTDRLPARRGLERTRIEVGDLVRWKHRESPPSNHAACEVDRRIVMTRDECPVADPDTRERVKPVRLERHIVLVAQPGQTSIDRGGTGIESRGMLVLQVLLNVV